MVQQILTLFFLHRIGYVLYRGDKGMKSLDVICTPNESSKYDWRGTDGSSVECVKGVQNVTFIGLTKMKIWLFYTYK